MLSYVLILGIAALCAADTSNTSATVQNYVRQENGRLLFREILNFINGDTDDFYDAEESNRKRNCTCTSGSGSQEQNGLLVKLRRDVPLSDCGQINQEIRIVGGRPTGVNRYPWLARLVYDGQFHCGGSLINEEYVLTAAHCVRRLKRQKLRIILGDHDQFVTSESPAIMRAVSAIIRHRNFDTNSYNHDIALLRLRKTVTFSKHIRPVCLPAATADDPSGKNGTVVGWGRTSEGGMLPGVLQEVQVPILSLAQCRTMKYKASRITPNMLCAGKGYEDSCQGDSGGPLLLNTGGDKHIAVGIVSWGVGCGRPGYPGVYTRVNRYLDWMERNLQDTCLCFN